MRLGIWNPVVLLDGGQNPVTSGHKGMDYLSTGARSLGDHFFCAIGGHEAHNTDKKCFFGHPLQPCTGTTP